MTYKRFTDEDSKIDNCDYVQFNAFFTRDLDQDGYAEKIAGTCKKIGESDTLYMDINVLTQGYLKNGQITLNAKNFTWTTAIVDDNIVDGNYIGETTSIKLDESVYNGSQKILWGTIKSNLGRNINSYSQINTVTLTGTYVSDDGVETEINKTVELTVDWYGETKTEVRHINQKYDIDILKFIDNSVTFSFEAAISETQGQLLLEKQVLEITIPKLKDYSATQVIVENPNIEYEYDEKTEILTIIRNSQIDEDGNITRTVSRDNTNDIKITYPREAYEQIGGDSVILSIPIKGYNYGYNNKNEEFQNPDISEDSDIISATYSHPTGEIWNVRTNVGESIYDEIILKDDAQSLYNGNEYEYDELVTKYFVAWNVFVADHTAIQTITLEEQKNEKQNISDEFLDSSGNFDSMYDYIRTTGIYFEYAKQLLGDDGWIKLYNDETGELIHTFTKDDFETYSEENPYKVNLKSIKIETSSPIDDSLLYVIQVKELDDVLLTKNYTQSEFDNLKYIYTYVKGTIKAPEGLKYDTGKDTSELNKANKASYIMPYSSSEIKVNPRSIYNQNIQNIDITIEANYASISHSKWKNGRFLVEMPENITNLNINNIKSLNSNVEITSYETYKENGKQYIKIYTKNEEETSFDIKINANIAINPVTPTTTQDVILYSYNEYCDNYYESEQDIFDLDTDGNTSDYVGKAYCILSINSPTGLLTAEYITNYDDEGNITIAPNVAEINLNQGKTATINIDLLNNYNGTISDVAILGRTPFKNNTYALSDKDLNSQFTMIMKSEINIPEQLQDKITVYYSTNEKTNKDLTDETNNWVKSEQVKDWSKIKTYLIMFNDYVLKENEKQIFTYDVEIVDEVKYNLISYCAHAIYYNLDTENGKLAIKTEPNKVGIKVIRKFNLQITKNKKQYENILVQGAIYQITTIDENGYNITKTETTDENGNLNFKNLNLGQEYTLKEIVAPDNYEVSKDEIKFIINKDQNEEPVVEIIEGSFSKTSKVMTDESGNYQIQVNLEDEPKYDLIINKTNENGEKLENVKFSINGKDKRNKKYKTNSEGITKITGLYLNETYELSEVESDGYYIDEVPREFKLVRNSDGNIVIETQDSDLQNATIVDNDTIIKPQVSINIKNEKIPTYNINIIKVEEKAEDYNSDKIKKLENANFNLLCQDTVEFKNYSTDENGSILISGLYEYVNNKYITGKYTLQETKAPVGYSNNNEKINFRASRNSQGELQVEIENEEELETIRSVYVQDDTIYFILQDKPLFKLTKIDSETQKPLANAKFVIYEIDNFLNVVDYAKDVNGNYIGEKNENDNWVVTTDENGTIIIALPDGKYRIDEVDYPEGYAEDGVTEYFVVGRDGDNKKINYIEDLVDLSISTNKGNNYDGITSLLMRTLDFNENSSYKNPEDTSYGDLNGDGTIEGIKAELTDKNDGCGFTPIGNDKNPFSGVFDGQGYEIKNLYINDDEDKYVGLFGYIGVNSEIKNLGLAEISIIYNRKADYKGGCGGIVGNNEGNIDNCYVDGSMDFNVTKDPEKMCSIYIGGIVGYNRKTRKYK